MDKPTGDENFITLDELLEHWDVSKKTLRRQIRKLSHQQRADFVQKVPIGERLYGEDGKEHFYYTLERDFWMELMESHYSRKRKYRPVGESLDTPPGSGGQSPAKEANLGGQDVRTDAELNKDLEEEKRVLERKEAVAQQMVSYLEGRIREEGDRFERMQKDDRDKYLEALGQKDFLISGLHQEIGELKALQAPKPADSVDTGDGQSPDSPTQPESTAQQSPESHGQESE